MITCSRGMWGIWKEWPISDNLANLEMCNCANIAYLKETWLTGGMQWLPGLWVNIMYSLLAKREIALAN